MAISITPAELKEIFPTALSDAGLQVFIDAATRHIESVLGEEGFSEALLTDITLFASAHFAHSASPRVESEAFPGYKMKVQGDTELNWDATFYGQNALALDTSGKLGQASTRKLKLKAYRVIR